ncbi:MAG: hypothetical protein V2I26_14350 [Halieaceae bacterium]|jgi:hypothetical protein|nr:hypothetical protein [Halieaceae bacterium]
MTGLFTVIACPPALIYRSLLRAAWLACALLLVAPPGNAQPGEAELELQSLARERDMFTAELEQYKSTVALLQTDDTPPEQSSNPALRKLALEMVRLKEQLIAITERELTLLQEQISAARQMAELRDDSPGEEQRAIESKPLRQTAPDYTHANEREHVERLHALLASYYAELQEAARTLPSEAEMTARAAARADAEKQSHIPFSVDKIRLNGAEGSTALSEITRRLSDPNIPESRRDVAPICSIRTQLFGSLIASERRSLKPVGKNNYVARIRLQPGETTLRIKEDRWDIQLPQNVNAGDFLITLYIPPDSSPELHLFAVDDLMAEQDPHIPAWLPDDIKLTSRSG